MPFCLLFVNSAWQISSHLFNDCLDSLDFLALGQPDDLLEFFATDSCIGITVLDVDTSYLARLQSAFFAMSPLDSLSFLPLPMYRVAIRGRGGVSAVPWGVKASTSPST